ncbi:unnamed protein product [Gadus morhua 'NCC']
MAVCFDLVTRQYGVPPRLPPAPPPPPLSDLPLENRMNPSPPPPLHHVSHISGAIYQNAGEILAANLPFLRPHPYCKLSVFVIKGSFVYGGAVLLLKYRPLTPPPPNVQPLWCSDMTVSTTT